ncbi:hypothetical protein D3C78_729460 [compost metagenome]
MLVDIVGSAQLAVRAGLVGGAGDHHETQSRSQVVGGVELAVGAGHQRVVGLQRDENHVGAALGHQVQAVVEELAEEGHPRVEAGAQAFVGSFVGNEEHLAVVVGAEYAVEAGAGDARRATIGGDCRRVIGGLVGDQVADGARLRVEHRAAGLLVRGGAAGGLRAGAIGVEGGVLGGAEHRVKQSREQAVGSAECALSSDQVVVAAIHRAQAEGNLGVGQQAGEVLPIRMGLGDEDLLKNEFQVGFVEVGHLLFSSIRQNARKTRPGPRQAGAAGGGSIANGQALELLRLAGKAKAEEIPRLSRTAGVGSGVRFYAGAGLERSACRVRFPAARGTWGASTAPGRAALPGWRSMCRPY